MAKHVKELLNSSFIGPEQWKLTLLQEWNSIVGDLKIQVRLEKINNDTVILAVSNSGWMQELYCLSDVLLKKINAKLDYPYVKKIRFKYGAIRNTMPAQRTRDYKKLKPIPEIILTATQKKSLEKIVDIELQAALKNFLARCYQNSL